MDVVGGENQGWSWGVVYTFIAYTKIGTEESWMFWTNKNEKSQWCFHEDRVVLLMMMIVVWAITEHRKFYI